MSSPWYTKYSGGMLQDTQEKQSWVEPALCKRKIQVTRTPLSSGDYGWISNGVRYLWEMKWDNADFYHSLFSGRLRSQLQRCLVESDRAFLGLVTLVPWDSWTTQSVADLLWKFRNWGVQVTVCDTQAELMEELVVCFNVSANTWPLSEQKKVMPVLKAPTPLESALRNMRVGIGPQGAAVLVGKYRTLEGLVSVSKEELSYTLGGKTKIAQNLWEAIHGSP